MKKVNIMCIYSRSIEIQRINMKPEFQKRGCIKIVSIITRWFWFKPKIVQYGYYSGQDTWYQLTGSFKKVPHLDSMLYEELWKDRIKEIRLESKQKILDRISSEMESHKSEMESHKKVFEAHGIDINGDTHV